jgi:preprotein translocase subunit YajC
MFITPAFAQGAPGGVGGALAGLEGIIPLLVILPIFYFLLIRPQQQRQKQHSEMVAGVKRGDNIVMSSGIIGVVSKVINDTEVEVEIAPNTKVRVIKSMIGNVRGKNEPVKSAND